MQYFEVGFARQKKQKQKRDNQEKTKTEIAIKNQSQIIITNFSDSLCDHSESLGET